jgi:TrmH family RNA methyltransferase
MVFISSPSNPRIRALQHLHASRGRKKSGLFLMEGPHLLEVLLDAQLEPDEIYYQPELLRRTASGQKLLERLLHTATIKLDSLIEVSERVIEVISEAQTAQGVVCVLQMNAFASERTRKRRSERLRPALLILDDLADPGNMGTILRTALAADVDEVLLTAGCVDYYSPKVVRAAAGAHIALPVETDLSWAAIEERVKAHCPAGSRVLLAEAGSSHFYYEQDLTRPFALIIGNEAHGPSREAHAMATLSITIPLANQVESLNAAMATGIILYEGVRQTTLRDGGHN